MGVVIAGTFNAKADRTFLNYHTGETFVAPASTEYNPVCTRSSDGNASIIEWTINYAEIRQPEYYPQTILWDTPTFYAYEQEDKPQITCTYLLADIDSRDITVTVEAAEYKDFSGYSLSPMTPVLPDCEGCGPVMFKIEPYPGYYPTEIYGFEDVFLNGKYRENLVFFPIQYDYENKTVRAYTKVKFRIEKTDAGIDDIAADNGSPVFYNLQGIKVRHPRKGQVYIEYLQSGRKHLAR